MIIGTAYSKGEMLFLVIPFMGSMAKKCNQFLGETKC